MEIDYKKLGFKAGIEIHQQLDTGKLFCDCPSIFRSDEPIFEVRRKLHKVPGESGEVDVAAAYQQAEDKEFVYQAHDTTCLVELDEEPPHKINQDALYIALQIAELFNCKIIPITQVMRKTVINGSNTSGFQRTVMYARDGYIETSKGRVGINFILLEEDSARKSKTEGKTIYWNLDRLGVPLVEVVTAPDIKDALHAKEVALTIGDILRSAKVRRGLGTIRQDINISIKGSNRVEIKGFQDPKIMKACVDNEIMRQKGLLELSKVVPKFSNPEVKSFDLDVKLDWMKKAIGNGAKFVGFKAEGFKGVFGKEFFPGYRVGTDLARYAKTRGFGGIIHGDEDLENKYKLSKEDVKNIKSILEVGEKDSFMMVLGDEDEAKKMFEEVLFPRMRKLNEINPKEVRNSLPDATTDFLRPMPGSARMYPETDLELLHISRDLINDVKKNVPKLRSEIEKDLKKEGLSEDMIGIILKEGKFDEFNEIVSAVGMPKVVGKAMLLLPREIAVKEGRELSDVEEILDNEKLIFVLEHLKAGDFEEGDLRLVLERVLEGEDLEKAVVVEKVDNTKVESFVASLIKEKSGLRPNAYMGLVMKEFSGQVDAKSVMQIIGKILG